MRRRKFSQNSFPRESRRLFFTKVMFFSFEKSVWRGKETDCVSKPHHLLVGKREVATITHQYQCARAKCTLATVWQCVRKCKQPAGGGIEAKIIISCSECTLLKRRKPIAVAAAFCVSLLSTVESARELKEEVNDTVVFQFWNVVPPKWSMDFHILLTWWSGGKVWKFSQFEVTRAFGRPARVSERECFPL